MSKNLKKTQELFDVLFHQNMSGRVRKFKYCYKTLYNKVIIPLAVKRYEQGFLDGLAKAESLFEIERQDKEKEALINARMSRTRKKIFLINAPCPLQEELQRLSQAIDPALDKDDDGIQSSLYKAQAVISLKKPASLGNINTNPFEGVTEVSLNTKNVPNAISILQNLIHEPSFKSCKIERLEDGSVLVIVNP